MFLFQFPIDENKINEKEIPMMKQCAPQFACPTRFGLVLYEKPHNNNILYTEHHMLLQNAVRMHAMTRYFAGDTENSISIEEVERHQSVLRSRPLERKLICGQQKPYILYLIPVTKDPVPLNITSPQNDTTPKLTQTPDHTTPPHTAPISNSLPTIKTLYTYTLTAFTPHSSAFLNTTLYTHLLLQDRKLQAVERSRFS